MNKPGHCLGGKPSVASAIWFLLLLVAPNLFAQHHPFKHYAVSDGLGSNVINHIYPDHQGYLWFSTQGGGACRFDGKEFKSFKRANGLAGNDVTWITEDRNHQLWIATTEGASLMKGTRIQNFGAAQGLTDGVVYCICARPDGSVWFGTETAGLKIWKNGKFSSAEGLGEVEVYTIAAGPNGLLFFGTNRGVFIWKNNQAEPLPLEEPLRNKSFFSSATDPQGKVWMGATSGEVICISDSLRPSLLSLPETCAGDFIGSISCDRYGHVWMGTDHGVLKYDGKQFKIFGTGEGLSVNAVQAVAFDYENNLWAGTLDGGANLLLSEAFVQLITDEELLNYNVTSICSLPKMNALAIGTDNGLLLKQNEKTVKVKSAPFNSLAIASLCTDSRNNLWIAAQEGIFVAEQKIQNLILKKSYTSAAGKKIISPQQIVLDPSGNIWVGTYGSGLFRFSPTQAQCFDLNNGCPADKILAVHADRKGRIWLGTPDAGIAQLEGNKFQTLRIPVSEKAPAFQDKAVWAIAEAQNGTLFFGMGESGLIVLSPDGKIRNIGTKDGLISDFVSSLQYDSATGALWAGTERGLQRILFLPDGRLQSASYAAEDGLTPVTVNHHALLKTRDGMLWIGTAKGLWGLDERLIRSEKILPVIRLQEVKLFYGKESLLPYAGGMNENGLPEKLVLPHHQNHLTFSLKALTPKTILYSYRFKGPGNQWSPPVSNPEITFSNLEPGRQYTFMARAITPDGKPGQNIAAFSFEILAPWWQTTWFYLLSALVLVLMLVIIIKARERVLKNQNLILENKVQQRTAEIEQQKKIVEKMLGEKEMLVKEIHHRVKNNLQTISSMLMLQSEMIRDEAAQQAIQESQNRVHSIALVHQKLYQSDGLEKIELGAFVRDLCENIAVLYPEKADRVKLQLGLPEVSLLIDKAIPLGLMLNELLTNSYKYAFEEGKEGRIEIAAQLVQETSNRRNIRLVYSDSGKGFDFEQKSKEGKTLGVELIMLLAEQIGAEISYSGADGSQFVFIFGINNL